jgi:hypothetical protein
MADEVRALNIAAWEEPASTPKPSLRQQVLGAASFLTPAPRTVGEELSDGFYIPMEAIIAKQVRDGRCTAADAATARAALACETASLTASLTSSASVSGTVFARLNTLKAGMAATKRSDAQ